MRQVKGLQTRWCMRLCNVHKVGQDRRAAHREPLPELEAADWVAVLPTAVLVGLPRVEDRSRVPGSWVLARPSCTASRLVSVMNWSTLTVPSTRSSTMGTTCKLR